MRIYLLAYLIQPRNIRYTYLLKDIIKGISTSSTKKNYEDADTIAKYLAVVLVKK